MKTLLHLLFTAMLLVAGASRASAQATAFTYQGRLQDNGSPANGTYSLSFVLLNSNVGGVAVAGPVTNNAVDVTNGLFTTAIDFGSGVFTGTNYWLQVAVATNGDNSFTNLTPLQQLTPAPYAIFAASASNLLGTVPGALLTSVPAASLTGTLPVLDAGSLTNLNASALASIGNNNGGSNNFFFGASGNTTTSGSNNTANGFGALFFNANGSDNTASGPYALYDNISGSYNSAFGPFALYANTKGSYNTAYGPFALYENTNGTYNTAIGLDALAENTSGSYNTAEGYSALYFNTSGLNNIALGYQAGFFITTGSYNIDIGNQGEVADTNIIRIGTTQTQTFIAGTITGNGGGLTNVNASALASIGNSNGGFDNFFVGGSGNTTMSGSFNTAYGPLALDANINGNQNTAIGLGAVGNNTSGSDNTAIGVDALFHNTSGSDNTAIGLDALQDNTSGLNNIALGNGAGFLITTGSSNIDIGNQGEFGDTNVIRIGTTQTQTFIAGTITGDGGGLTDLNAAQVSGTFSSLTVAGSQPGGYGSDEALIQNTNTTGNTGPALRVVGYGNTAAGALSVSSQGTGLIAQFGNGTSFVGDITTNGTFEGSGYNGGTLRVGGNGTVITNLEAGQAIMPASSLQETNYTIAFPTAFSASPKIIFSLANDPDFQGFSDVFASSVSSNSPAAFSVNVYRLNGTSWSQQLRINWQAWQ